LKREKILGLCYLIAIISLVGAQFFFIFQQQPEYDGRAQDVYAEDDIAYIADYYYGLIIMDASNPSNPYEIGRLDQPSTYDSGNQIYVRNQIKVAYLVGNDDLRLIDVSDPSNPTQFSVLSIPSSVIWGMFVDYPFFYLYHSPSQLGFITLENSIRDVCISDDIAYVGYEDGLKIIDVSNSSNPIALGQIGDTRYHNCVVNDTTVYATRWIDYLDIIDVSDPSNPTIINHYNKGRHSAIGSGIEFLNNTLYVPDMNYGLELIDVSDPTNPFKCAQLEPSRLTENIYIDYPYAYVTCDFEGLVIIDISNPSIWSEYSIINTIISIISIGVVACYIALKLFKHKIGDDHKKNRT